MADNEADGSIAATLRDRVSVIIPAFNEADRVATAIRSVRAASPDVEVVVVDDGSTDRTAEIARSAGARVVEQPNAGPGAARMTGARSSDRPILVFTDADCEASPEFVAEIVRPLVTDPGCDVAMGRYLTRDRRVIGRLAQVEFEQRYGRLESSDDVDFAATYAMAVTREAFRRAGGFDPDLRMSEDVELAWRLHDLGHRFRFVPTAAVYHEHAAGWWDYMRVKRGRAYWRIRAARRHRSKLIDDSYTPFSLKAQVGAAIALLLLGPLIFASRPARRLAAGLIVVTSATSASLVRTAVRTDRSVAPVVPVFVAARGVAMAVGVLEAVLGRRLGQEGT